MTPTEQLERIQELERYFDLRRSADMRAIKRWQAAGPNRELTWPDHADLVVWLLEENEKLRVLAHPSPVDFYQQTPLTTKLQGTGGAKPVEDK